MLPISNIIDYAENTFSRFSEMPFNEVDSLILSQFIYMRLPEELFENGGQVRIHELLHAEYFTRMLSRTRVPELNKRLLFALAASPRFRNIEVSGYTECFDVKEEEQFAAAVLKLDRDTVYIAFRGTDATFIGWKEDFNMAFCDIVPSQRRAVAFLENVAEQQNARLIAGGHSKGGNLAVFAAAMCKNEVRARLTDVYSHDGPGFRAETFSAEGFRAIEHIVRKTVPQSSVVGMIMENYSEYRIVRSDRYSFMQHDPFSWLVDTDCFLAEPRLSVSAEYTDKTISGWLSQLSDSERELLVNTLYAKLSAENVSTVAEFGEHWSKNTVALISSIHRTDADVKNALSEMLKKLVVQMIPHKETENGEASLVKKNFKRAKKKIQS